MKNTPTFSIIFCLLNARGVNDEKMAQSGEKVKDVPSVAQLLSNTPSWRNQCESYCSFYLWALSVSNTVQLL